MEHHRPCALYSGTHSSLHTFIQTHHDDFCFFFLRFFKINAIHFDTSKSPCVYLPDWDNKMNYWLHIMLLALYDSSICVQYFVLICLWFNWVQDASNQMIQVGLLDRLINKQVLLTYAVQILLMYCSMSSKPDRAYPAPFQKDTAFIQSSIKFTPNPKSFLPLTYLREKYILLIFSVCIKQRPFGIKTECFRS